MFLLIAEKQVAENLGIGEMAFQKGVFVLCFVFVLICVFIVLKYLLKFTEKCLFGSIR